MTLEDRPEVLATDSVAGDRVVNIQNEDLGTIEHVKTDIENARIAFAVLSFGEASEWEISYLAFRGAPSPSTP